MTNKPILPAVVDQPSVAHYAGPISRVLLTCTALLVLAGCGRAWVQKTPLDRYVAEPDPSYRYELASEIQGEGYRAFVIDMTSQTWRTEAEVDRTEWKHWLTIVVPDEVTSSTSLLFIGGGGNGKPAPEDVDEKLHQIATTTQSVVVGLGQIPNQPITFTGEEEGRSEDALIAYGWDQYLRGGDDEWLAHLPMTKAAVRAMDTVTDFCGQDRAGAHRIDSFVVAGGSKRGWTTWTTAAVDKRVIAIIPIVIDMLNVQPSFRHHWEVYGFYAPAVGDYQAMKIMEREGTPRYRELCEIVEPYEYRDRLTMPKFMINATGDQFFLPDSWKFYWDELRGPKSIRYVPNADHSLGESDAIETLLACYNAVIHAIEIPQYAFEVTADDAIHVTTASKPDEVLLWQATNPDARDFRVETIDKAWTSSTLEPNAEGDYQASVPTPATGSTAFMIELTYQVDGSPTPFKFTSGVHVVPNVTPFDFETKQRRE